MSLQSESDQRLRRLFTQGFSVMDIAEPLISYDAARPAGELRAMMAERRLRVAGVRCDGQVTGYVTIDALGEGRAADVARPFPAGSLLCDDASLPQVFQALIDARYAFVRILGQVGGIVSRTDVGKPAVRMWLFGMVTILEGFVGRMVRERFTGDRWQEHVTEGRLAKALELQAERARRGENVDLVDCLQLTDKAHILLRDPALIAELGLGSRREGKQLIKALESLRNNLAHAQDIVASNWDTILGLSMRLDRVLTRV